jgi:hypothetical protein
VNQAIGGRRRLGPVGFHPSACGLAACALRLPWSRIPNVVIQKLNQTLGSGKLVAKANRVLNILMEDSLMGLIKAVRQRLFKDKRPEWEIQREREFIQAANRLKTLRVTPRGGMSIDPEEIRDQIIAAREEYKHLVRK